MGSSGSGFGRSINVASVAAALTAVIVTGVSAEFSLDFQQPRSPSNVRVLRTHAAVSQVAVSGITATGATITWITAAPADSQVEYGTTASFGTLTPLDPTLVTSHSVVLTGLLSDRVYYFRVRSRDSLGNLWTSLSANFTTVANSVVVQLSPDDTSINLNTTNYSTATTLTTYTWPDQRVANAVLMKFNVSSLPPGTIVQDAKLNLALTASDSSGDPTYGISVHKIVGKNPNISTTTGFTVDGVTAWTPNTCCANNVPMAQADIAQASDVLQIDKSLGFKAWTITPIVQEWLADPATNFGVLLNPDTTKIADRYRYFASMEDSDPAQRPYLRITYTVAPPDPTPPTVSMTAPASGATVSGTVTVSATASDNVGVASVQFELDGAGLGSRDTSAPFSISWNTATATTGTHTLRAVARDAAGNVTTSAPVTVTVVDATAPVISGVAASGITSVGAVIAWTTNEASDSQVEYGTTTSYGTSTALNVSLVTAHTMSLVGLSPNTLYHYRVRSRDAAGNLTTSTDFTFTTLVATGSLWTNEPAGFAPVEETGWESGTLGNWSRISTSADKPIDVADITSSVIGESKTLQIDYPAGHVGGGGTELRFDIPPASRKNEVYVGFYVQVNSQWQGHSSGINKMVYLHDGGASFSAMWYEMFGSGSNPLDLSVVNQSGSGGEFHENVNQVTFNRGQWHKVEIYQKQGSPGIVRVWVDGVLAIDRSDITTKTTPVDNVTISGTWGGVGDTKNQADYMRFDRIRISAPAGTPPPPPPTVLFQENFEDANLSVRGWYDNTTPLLSTAEHIPNSTRSIEFKFNQGWQMPTAANVLRRKFTASDSVYVSYWVKYSTNWVGSQRPYHPHEFHFLTNVDGDWSGLSFTHLTAYIEQNGGTPLIALQDGANIDQTRIGVNLTNVTELRGVAGCNGSSDGYPDNCYLDDSGFVWVNEKKWAAPSRVFTDTPGPFYKNDWHFVEAYIKMNTLVSNKGVNDGIIQYWFDGQLMIDKRDVLIRTGAFPTIKFNQFVIAPYIGDGSPVTQSMWIDNLTVATGRQQ